MIDLTRAQRWRRHAIEAVVGGVIGAGFGFGIASFVDSTGFDRWTIAELASLGIGFMLFFMGGFALVMSASEQRWRRLVAFRQPGSEPPDRDSMLAIRRQGVIIALSGPILAAPPVLAHLGLGADARAISAAAVLAALAGQTWLNWRLYRTSDELMRRVSLLAGAVCFWGAQLALFIWATLAKLEIVADVDSWTLLTLVMALYLVVSTWISFRRGLGQL
ncbi:MAG: hypothetical protein EOP58_05835 [Sphingomonadales bacterium]|nr:MAG: hypothetical protein EOP58_05835 [Sphingomonadales bacterium]